jgi:ABC-type transport system involved in multi-copper enzyme maturation permease subunit
MVGAVVSQEMLLGGRRSRAYVFRWLLAAWLLVQLAFQVMATLAPLLLMRSRSRSLSFAACSDAARGYIELYVGQQFVLLALATPALAAGALTDEKTRGTLQYLLAADLYPWEIVLGKLVGRSGQVLLLALTGLPLLCFFGVFGGLDGLMILAVAISTLAFVFGLGSASLLASVWCRHTRDAVLSLYAILVGLAMVEFGLQSWRAAIAWAAVAGTGSQSIPPPLSAAADFLRCLDPFYPFAAGWTLDPAAVYFPRALRFTLAWGGLGVGCVLLASWRLRPAYVRQLAAEGKNRKPRWWRARRPPVGNSPLRWKERHVEGVAPLAVLRGLPRWLGLVLVFAVTAGWCAWIVADHLPPGESLTTVLARLIRLDFAGLGALAMGISPAPGEFFRLGVAVMLLAGVVIGIRCSGAVTGERERQTWEALLLTPLETWELIRAKLWGIIGASYPYLVAYAVPALALAALCGVEALFWTGLWLAVTWLALCYVGAAGLWCSVRSRSSWRSLLGTLGFTYLGGFVLYCVTSALAGILAMMLMLALMLLEYVAGDIAATGAMRFLRGMSTAYPIAFCIILAGAFILLGWMLIRAAEYRVGILERTKHWKREPLPRLRRPVRSYE